MTEALAKQHVFLALSLLKDGRRDDAAGCIAQALAVGPPSGDQWKNIAMLAGQIGEIELSLEASRRFSQTRPVKLSKLLHYWRELIGFGRGDIVEAQIAAHDAAIREHPAVLHILGQLAAEKGDFERANELYLRVVGLDQYAHKAWFSLAMITDMKTRPDWVARMEALAAKPGTVDSAARARLLYALAKAHHDRGDHAQAFAYYRQGADARRSEGQYQPERMEALARRLIEGFDAASLSSLHLPQAQPKASIFVNGLPRSGTTLVEQILVAHSKVADGGEVNLARAALTPTVNYDFDGAQRLDKGSADGDPWGRIALNYQRMLAMRFRTPSLVVDKTLTQSQLMGLILHAMPACPIIWVRRRREDVALSCFRTFFTSPLPWCWDFASIGHFIAVEDALYEHWRDVGGSRILTVPYEELVAAPERWIPDMARFAGLEWEEGMLRFHNQKRPVRTASLQQVRRPISTAAIGQAEAYAPFMGDFQANYDATRERLRRA